jgi:toxin ParE1/3/4
VVAHYRKVAGQPTAEKLVAELKRALRHIERNPSSGSPILGQILEVVGLRTWRIEDFPLSFWYFERNDHVDIARLVGQRQDALGVDIS